MPKGDKNRAEMCLLTQQPQLCKVTSEASLELIKQSPLKTKKKKKKKGNYFKKAAGVASNLQQSSGSFI